MSWTKQQANSKTGEGKFEKAPAGNHPAVLVAIIDMGTQRQEYQGNVTWPHRVYFVWELVEEKQTGYKDKNHVIALDLTVSLNAKSKLRKWVEARTGKQIPDGSEYDIADELGQPCLLNVVMNGDYPKVDGMGAVPKGMRVAAPQNKPVIMSLEEFKAGATIPDFVPFLFGEPLGDHIRRCKELTSEGGEQPASSGTPATSAAKSNQGATASTATSAPAAAGAPPRRKPSEPLYWLAATDAAEPVQVTLSQIKEMWENNKLDSDVAEVCPVGQSEYKKIPEAIPQSSEWVPF